jgi:hypothetical protein
MVHFRQMLYVFLTIIISACNLIDTPEPIPSYLEISNFRLDADANMGISDAWVYVNGEFIGVFNLPAKVPVLKYNAANVVLKPGVKFNGIASTRGVYYFYNDFTGNYTLKEGVTTAIKPQTSYNSSWVSLVFTEDFERAVTSFEYPTYSDTIIVPYNADKFMGRQSGLILLEGEHRYFEAYCKPQSADWFETPATIKQAGMFLELNYKNNSEFTVGLIIPASETKKIALVTFNKTDEWKKAYVDLHTYLQMFPPLTKYRVYIASSRPATMSKGEICLDNLRIIQ